MTPHNFLSLFIFTWSNQTRTRDRHSEELDLHRGRLKAEACRRKELPHAAKHGGRWVEARASRAEDGTGSEQNFPDFSVLSVSSGKRFLALNGRHQVQVLDVLRLADEVQGLQELSADAGGFKAGGEFGQSDYFVQRTDFECSGKKSSLQQKQGWGNNDLFWEKRFHAINFSIVSLLSSQAE